MTDPTLSDITRLREIAEEGRRLPLLGGRHMILWGATVIVCSLFHWAVASRFVALPMMSIAACWFGLTALAGLLSSTSAMRGPSIGGHDIGNRIERTAWQYGGALLGLVAVSIFATSFLAAQQTGSTMRYFLFAMMPPLSFGVYAIALAVTATASGMTTLKPYAVFALGFAAATVLLAGYHWQFPVTALGIFIVAILPGRMLLAEEKRRG